jgi:extracellular factor (EF) 3-hydroxypalmitic acid methyl ester biosynthesis protein
VTEKPAKTASPPQDSLITNSFQTSDVDPLKTAMRNEGISFSSVEELRSGGVKIEFGPFAQSKQLVQNLRGQFEILPELVSKFGEKSAFQIVNHTLFELDRQQAGCTHSEINELKNFFRELILPCTLQSDFCRYVYEKPRGYAGDFFAMELIWKGSVLGGQFRYSGTSEMGKLINAFAIDSANCRANVERVFRLSQEIANGHYLNIVSIGCGSSIELDLALTINPSLNFRIWLLDQDSDALQLSVEKLNRLNHRCDVTALRGNVLKSIYGLGKQRFDLIYSTGMFDYFNLKTTQKIVTKLWESVSPAGKMLITNAHPQNPTRLFMEFGGDWYLEYKDMNQMMSFLSDREDLAHVSLVKDWNSVYQYISFIKK